MMNSITDSIADDVTILHLLQHLLLPPDDVLHVSHPRGEVLLLTGELVLQFSDSVSRLRFFSTLNWVHGHRAPQLDSVLVWSLGSVQCHSNSWNKEEVESSNIRKQYWPDMTDMEDPGRSSITDPGLDITRLASDIAIGSSTWFCSTTLRESV